ncbi:hypothetical protein [Nocardia cyriacigeorgica]|nr:hypothetical protein [Nocardia cyriacigeorgica]
MRPRLSGPKFIRDYEIDGVSVTTGFKGPGRDRAVYTLALR